MNSVNLIGRLTADPDMREYKKSKKETGTIAKFTIAVDRNGDDTNFINCTAFGKSAEFTELYLTKGMKIGISGYIHTGSFQNKKGDTVYTTEVIATDFTFCEPRKRKEREKDEE